MSTSFKKILRLALVCGMISSLLTTAPPLTMLSALADCHAAAANVPDNRAFASLDVSEMTLGFARFLFRPLQESEVAVFERDCARFHILNAKVFLYEQTKFVAEFRDYSFANDLHFNLPHFSSRQAPGEPATEG